MNKTTPGIKTFDAAVHLGSRFVVSAFLARFVGGVAFSIARTVDEALGPGQKSADGHTTSAAIPMASILSAAQDICSWYQVTDEESLTEMLIAVLKQFEVTREFDEVDQMRALEKLTHYFSAAAQEARDTLAEVQAGFPASRGDFVAWQAELSRRHQGNAALSAREFRELMAATASAWSEEAF